MSNKAEKILKSVKDALGGDVKYFDIEKSEVLVEEENYYSMTVQISPKKDVLAPYNCIIKGENHILQFDTFDDEVNLMVGEDADNELNVTYGNIYAQLYWGEVIDEK